MTIVGPGCFDDEASAAGQPHRASTTANNTTSTPSSTTAASGSTPYTLDGFLPSISRGDGDDADGTKKDESKEEPCSGREKIQRVLARPVVLVSLAILVLVAGLIVAIVVRSAGSSSLVQHDYYGSANNNATTGGSHYSSRYGHSSSSSSSSSSRGSSSSSSSSGGSSSSSSSSGGSSSSHSGGSSSFWGWFGGSGGGHSSGGGHGSSGGGHSSSCFPPGQQVLLAGQREQVPIERVRPGSMLHLGGRVTAVVKLPALFDRDPLYQYNGSVLVTGSHLVHELGDWIPVEQSRFAVPLALSSRSHAGTEPPPRFVFNLITANHRMVVNNATLFADWEEWENCVENWGLESQLLRRLNRGRRPGFELLPPIDRNDHRREITEGAFLSGTPILLQNGTTIPIQSIQPGDQLYNERDDDEKANDSMNRVFAVMKLWIPEGTSVYRYRSNANNVSVTVTEWTIVLDEEDGIWRNVQYSSNSELIGTTTATTRLGGSPSSTWYQLWTTTHKVPVTAAGLLFADYHVIDEDDPIFSELC